MGAGAVLSAPTLLLMCNALLFVMCTTIRRGVERLDLRTRRGAVCGAAFLAGEMPPARKGHSPQTEALFGHAYDLPETRTTSGAAAEYALHAGSFRALRGPGPHWWTQ